MIHPILQEDSIKGQVSRFLIAGGITTLVNYLIFAALFFLSFNYIVSSAVGYASGFCLGFILFKRFTFKSQGNWKTEAVKQIIVYSFSLALNLYALYALVHYINLSPLFANVVAIALSTITNFLGMKFFVFTK